ncbi:PREDICTED: uncharacterized protein LOC109236902 [Nicotiana attenuata]|uniref:uncharacterized protein LOC109236902 n=1 Tax=Nicotiana attenuata TaxID=49451 RepID=UPI0009048ACB|nr:PREDICTED: uncharacterized protein LOC109236902 [Nicotiana attenuata]
MQPADTTLMQLEKETYQKFRQKSYMAEVLLQQRSKAAWVKLGPDGYGSEFFRAAWKIIGTDITEAILNFFENGKLLTQLNATMISLIPNIEVPQDTGQFRSISCCNVIYKCISKMICKRLSMVIKTIVAENQAAFVEGRSLLVMTCISTTRFFVKVNGVGYGYFEGKRGLWRGDPMSPFLFVLVMEYLTRILKRKSNLPDFKFYPMCKKTKLTHLLFVDDLMIFCKGDIKLVSRVREALQHFSEVTGLERNLDKSNLFVAGVDEELKKQLLDITGFSWDLCQ